MFHIVEYVPGYSYVVPCWLQPDFLLGMMTCVFVSGSRNHGRYGLEALIP